MGNLLGFVWQLLMIPLAFFIGRFQERRHFQQLQEREAVFGSTSVNNLKHVSDPDRVKHATMVMGHVVIATDYYKSFATSLRNLVGGEMKSAQSLLVRARREALVRLLAEARCHGAAEVWNVRFGFCNIAQMSGRTGTMQIEMLAYGTAVVRS